MATRRSFIYGLSDPRTLLIRYVGLTTVGMSRPRAHRVSSTTEGVLCKAWLLDMAAEDCKPDIVILADVQISEIKAEERWWIAFGRACGWPLTNLTDGGQGLLNPHPSTRDRLRQASIRYASDPAVRAALSERAKRQMQSAEQREARRISSSARTPEQIAAYTALSNAARALIAAQRPPGYKTATQRRAEAGAERKRLRVRRVPKPKIVRPPRAIVVRPKGLTPEGRQRLSEQAAMRQSSQEARAAIGARTKAAFASPEARERLSKAVATAWTPERRLAMSEHARKRQAAPEVKSRISESSRRAAAERRKRAA